MKAVGRSGASGPRARTELLQNPGPVTSCRRGEGDGRAPVSVGVSELLRLPGQAVISRCPVGVCVCPPSARTCGAGTPRGWRPASESDSGLVAKPGTARGEFGTLAAAVGEEATLERCCTCRPDATGRAGRGQAGAFQHLPAPRLPPMCPPGPRSLTPAPVLPLSAGQEPRYTSSDVAAIQPAVRARPRLSSRLVVRVGLPGTGLNASRTPEMREPSPQTYTRAPASSRSRPRRPRLRRGAARRSPGFRDGAEGGRVPRRRCSAARQFVGVQGGGSGASRPK
ncbi:hypothetical protein SALBM311S_02383 [Streptomyces alboniger]